MDFQVIDKDTESKYQELKRRIWRLQSGATLDSMKNVGADTSRQIGASFVSLKQLATHYTPDEQLALMLWHAEKREEQIMACFLFPENLNKEKITQLFDHCLNMEIAGYLGSLYLYRHPQLLSIGETCLLSGEPVQQMAILSALAKHLLVNKENSLFDKACFSEILHREYKDKFVRLTAERYLLNL